MAWDSEMACVSAEGSVRGDTGRYSVHCRSKKILTDTASHDLGLAPPDPANPHIFFSEVAL